MSDMARMPVPLARPRLGDAELDAVRRVLASRHLAQGPEVAALEQEAGAMLGGRQVVAVSSGGSALLLALSALGIGKGDEVVVPAFTFPAAAQAAAWLGAVPVPADVDPDTLAVTAETVEAVMTGDTRAIVVSHAFGIPADVERVVEAAMGRDLDVIEDAACAFGGFTARGARAGTVGKLACFSLHPRKLVTGGEGGMVACDGPMATRVRSLKDYGRTGSGFGDIFGDMGLNFRLSDLCAAVARVQLTSVAGSIASRANLAKGYIERLDGVNGVGIPRGYFRNGQTWQSFVVRVGEGAPRLVKLMREKGVEAGPSAHDLTGQTFFRKRWGDSLPCPVSAALAGELVALPLFDEMSLDQVDRVVDTLVEALGEIEG
ncbi:MAG: aminotransferase class I/II-fold pyridoxal phosphate-dependent enzyme [Deltaproteobacteria bacterium]|nr:aminotransferase class I/II-fold pyridoxal phosphate-dependent enzyme [Deltaproteobacteria bacterium]